MHIELISYSATAPGAAGAAAAAVTGDTLVVKNSKTRASILAWWAKNQTAGFHQLIAPSLHDTTRGMRVNVNADEVDPRLCLGTSIQPQPQETLSMTIAGSATAGDVESGCLLIHYQNLPGVDGRFIGWSDLQKKIELLTTISATLAGAAAGYTGVELINAESDLLRANRDYAVLGATTNTSCGALGLSGPDFGNVRLGVPGDAADNDFTQGWFATLSRAFGMPLIPVFNSGNRNAMNFSFLQDENNVSPLVTWYLALLEK